MRVERTLQHGPAEAVGKVNVSRNTAVGRLADQRLNLVVGEFLG